VNFWASSCIPCRREFPLLATALTQNSGLVVIGVAVLDQAEDASRFLRAHGKSWDSILDRNAIVAGRWRVRVLPVTYAIGLDGTIVDRQFGELLSSSLERMVRATAPTT
jgi:cytochrome c biogenesis protein CcmG, thiol:disulfide interchange protein DsbE